MDKSNNAYKTIGEVTKILNLKSNKKGELPTHTVRFWEKQFKQVKPKILNSNRRYLLWSKLSDAAILVVSVPGKLATPNKISIPWR